MLDPDMLLQLAKKSAMTTMPPGGGRGRGQAGRGEGGRGARGQQGKAAPSPYSQVDAWKSINGRPFARWTDPAVDVWDARFEGEGPPNAEWLETPPMQAELDRAAGVMEVRARFAPSKTICFFAWAHRPRSLWAAAGSSGPLLCLLFVVHPFWKSFDFRGAACFETVSILPRMEY